MKIEVFDDMIVIHSPDNSENNRFKAMNLLKDNFYTSKFIKDTADDSVNFIKLLYGKEVTDISYNEEQ